jgi:undecaprenyl-diphosphatase
MLDSLVALDHWLFSILNSFHTPGLDSLMLAFTRPSTWLLFYAWLIVLIVKKHGFPQGIFFVFLICLAVGLSDYVASGLAKPYFERLRPCHNATLQPLANLVGNCGGKYGFVSSHASTTMAVAISVGFVLDSQKRFIILLLTWAILIGFSRIYLGVHFPADVALGASLGGLISYLIFKIYSKLQSLKK